MEHIQPLHYYGHAARTSTGERPEGRSRSAFELTRDAMKQLVTQVRQTGLWIFFFIALYVIFMLKALTYDALFHDPLFGFYSLLITTYILSRFVLAYLHKPILPDLSYEPTVSFVVPAMNEEDNIAETMRCFARVDYPLYKLEVIAINDGSKDRTLQEMQRAAHELRPHLRRVEVVHWRKNRGKRHGMAEGVKRASHDIVIFIDSDSFIERDGVRHLVKYFKDPDVGAVSGHTDVHNADTNLLTAMQALRYYISFKVYKAAESVFGLVTCCPGCCSAYRRAYLDEYIDEWLGQTFLGGPCTFGDDRSLTNFMIRKYKATYSEEAKAHTVVPDNFKKYAKQQLRWKKSWIRETLIASTFMWRQHPIAAFSFYAYVFLAFASPIVFVRAMLWYPIVHETWPIIYLIGLLLMLLLHGLYYRIQVGVREWALAVTSFWLTTIVLIWQLPYAALTIRDSRWGTR